MGFFNEDDDKTTMDEMINQKNSEFIYNIKQNKEERIKLFAGEGGRFV